MRAFLKNFRFDLAEQGILGINSRNLDYVLGMNSRRFYPLVDDKLRTKALAEKVGVPTPQIYMVMDSYHSIGQFERQMASYDDFVLKPAKGSGGGGIIVIKEKAEQGYIRSSGKVITLRDLRHHISNILAGLYSLGGNSDVAYSEYRVRIASVFSDISFCGVPDVRIILYRGIPVMAMLRLPSHASDGKANLHAGGVGAGICLGSGKTIAAIQSQRYITHHPETGAPVCGVQIPFWREQLEIATKLADALLPGLGYIGVDLVLDEEKGPMLLEINARPGLAIQIANRCGLLLPLRWVDKHYQSLKTIDERVDAAMQNLYHGAFAASSRNRVA